MCTVRQGRQTAVAGAVGKWETRSVFQAPMFRGVFSMAIFAADFARPRCWRPIAQRRGRPPGVVLDSPLLDHDLCLLQRVKNLSVQTLVPQLPVEALAVSVLPGTSGLDIQR